ncbi:MAG: 3-isopropylmalate dehydrogenase [Rectinemataceae bacterium]
MKMHIGVIKGDGIGPEVVQAALPVLEAVAQKYRHDLVLDALPAGGEAIDATGTPLPDSTRDAALRCDAVLLGAVGGPKWDSLPSHLRPERALLGLRAALSVYANLRPARLLASLRAACPLKDTVAADGFDLLIVRELTGGIYFGRSGREEGGSAAFDTERYSWHEIERVLRVGYEAARGRKRKLCLVDKANVLETSRLWREVNARIAPEYPDISVETMYVDNCAMQLIRNPGQFDVIVTSNLFGDILSDEASMLTGSIGMLPSASLGDASADGSPRRGLYEPIHGSAPDIAGKDIANPLGTILSVALMLRYSFGLTTEARDIEAAVERVLAEGWRTRDLAASMEDDFHLVGTAAMAKKVREYL